ncbi:hypothetical protein CHS0354_009526 [Potamilus streckersoni]|uniref:Uncharacterized protein n=1 Tax=Potamilus streckersoni TaxID=2493646 RepID=A0AAE0SQ07_9BIVA|nr:hypothetical protein CHS0354_009526 [Potamilus streckersoni]
MIKTIKEWTFTIKDVTDKLEAAALEDLEQVCKQETLIISDQAVECESALAAVEISESILLEETRSNNDTKLFITTTRMSQQVRKYAYKYEAAIQAFREIQIEFKCDEKIEKLVKTVTPLGQVTSRNSEITMLLSDMSFERAIMLRPRARFDSMLTFKAKVPDDEKSCRIYSGIFLPDDKILASDEENKKLKLFGKCSHCLSYMNMKYAPRFMCIVDNQTVAVTTDSCKICIVSVNEKLAILRTLNIWNECYGITSYQQNLIVNIQNETGNSLVTYDKSFNEVKRISVPDYGNFVFNTVCVSPDGQITYHSSGNTIVAMNMDGTQINTFEIGVR